MVLLNETHQDYSYIAKDDPKVVLLILFSWITSFISSWEENNCYVKLEPCKADQIHKMTTLFIQDITVILFLALDKSRDSGANRSKLQHM